MVATKHMPEPLQRAKEGIDGVVGAVAGALPGVGDKDETDSQAPVTDQVPFLLRGSLPFPSKVTPGCCLWQPCLWVMPIQTVLLGRLCQVPGGNAAEDCDDGCTLVVCDPLPKSNFITHITLTTIQFVLAGDRCPGARLGTKSRLLGA